MGLVGIWYMEDLISVIVPVYNVEQYLERCINSIVNQTYKNLEIILIDDGSTDSSGSICDTLCTSDNRILVIHQDNGGISCARNTGIDHSRGKYVTFVDSDDWIDIRMIEKLYSRIIKDNSQIAFCNFAYVDQQGNEYYDESDKTDHILDENQFWHDYYLKKNDTCYIVSWAKLIRRDVFANGIRFRVGKIHEDEFIIHEKIKYSLVRHGMEWMLLIGPMFLNVARGEWCV